MNIKEIQAVIKVFGSNVVPDNYKERKTYEYAKKLQIRNIKSLAIYSDLYEKTFSEFFEKEMSREYKRCLNLLEGLVNDKCIDLRKKLGIHSYGRVKERKGKQ